MKKTYLYKNPSYEVEFEINDWAERSMISLLTKSKETYILTVINIGQETVSSDFLPLTVDYEEKFYAGGKIFGSRFIRREGRPTLTSILNARLIDRSIRPTFDPRFRKQIHIANTVLSYNPESDPAWVALLGTAFGLSFLGLPVKKIAGIRLGLYEDKWLINPPQKINNGLLAELFVSGTKNKINMIEFEGKEIKNEKILEGCKIAFEEIKKLISFFEEHSGQQTIQTENQEILEKADEALDKFLKERNINLEEKLFPKKEGEIGLFEIFAELNKEDFGDLTLHIFSSLQHRLKKIFQENVVKNKIRPDGRKLDEIRELKAEIDVLPRVHGSAIFQRGMTHILSTVTLAPPGEELVLREIEYEGTKHFIHHYNFPPYSTGELGSSKGPSRREIGHGELVEKALRNLVPSQEEFPYTIRVVSEVLSSNGSTSMGSVCSSSLALMSAGVPLKKHVAGISIGLAYLDDENYELLTDIQGPEDFFGGMDFKVAGTLDGVTAIQLDVKIEGLNFEQLEKALNRAEEARRKIIAFMKNIIAEHRKNVSPLAPKVDIVKIDPLKIGLVIGSGGRTINEIINLTNTKIDIHPDGLIYISGENLDDIEKAKNWIKIITESLKTGEIISGKVIRILPSGAILEISPQRTAFLHISEIANKKIENIENEIKIGEELKVLVKRIDENGKIYVSLKDARRKQ